MRQGVGEAGVWDGSALQASSSSKSYGSQDALVAHSVTIGPGEVPGLLGPSGSGMSTCLHIIADLIGADSGHVEACGHDGAQRQSRHWHGSAPDDLPLPAARRRSSLPGPFRRIASKTLLVRSQVRTPAYVRTARGSCL